MSEPPLASGEDWPAEARALRYGLDRLHFLGLLQAFVLSLRISDGFGQHLAHLSLGLCGFALWWLPCCHGEYVGCRKGKLNPLALFEGPLL